MTLREKKAWDKFMTTGSVSDYLEYKKEANAVQRIAGSEGEQTLSANHNGWLGAQTKEFR